MAAHKADEGSRRLAKIAGVGPIGAVLLKTPAPQMFRSGRQFTAWIGLTPKDHSTGDKVRLGVITRAGDEASRSVLVLGATAVIQHIRRGGRGSPWIVDLLKRKIAEIGRCGVGQQDGPRRLEADGHRRGLHCQIRARRRGERRIEISQTRGAAQL
jgi:transposase